MIFYSLHMDRRNDISDVRNNDVLLVLFLCVYDDCWFWSARAVWGIQGSLFSALVWVPISVEFNKKRDLAARLTLSCVVLVRERGGGKKHKSESKKARPTPHEA